MKQSPAVSEAKRLLQERRREINAEVRTLDVALKRLANLTSGVRRSG